MAFLDRAKTLEAIIEIIKEAKNEIIMIVPFVSTSPLVLSELRKANSSGKEILILYRENKLSEIEQRKLSSLNNLTMMSHPNVHSKCYLNEHMMVITSMNLYAPTEEKNREMGMSIASDFYDDGYPYSDAIKEIRSIRNASTLEKMSEKVKKNGFNYNILKPQEDVLKEYLEIINKVFIHKKFEIITSNAVTQILCHPYHEKIDVSIGYDLLDEYENPTILMRRIELDFLYEENKLERFHKIFWNKFQEEKFNGFSIYWDWHKSYLTIYANKKYEKWETFSFEESISKFKIGLDNMIEFIREIEKEFK